MRKLFLLAACLALLQPAAAKADISYRLGMGKILADQVLFDKVLVPIATGREAADDGSAPSTSSPAPKPATAPFKGTFKADPALRQAAIEKMQQRIAQASPTNAGEPADAIFAQFEELLAPLGLRTTSLADTAAVYAAAMHDAANGTVTRASAAQAQGLSEQFAKAFGELIPAEPGLQDPSLVQRQADLFVLQAWLVLTLNSSFAQPGVSASDRESYQIAMRDTGQKVFGLDLTEVEWTSRGLVQR
ncbi:MAG: hypothetical protein AAF494_05445 [Pseudomonadota bacterium]